LREGRESGRTEGGVQKGGGFYSKIKKGGGLKFATFKATLRDRKREAEKWQGGGEREVSWDWEVLLLRIKRTVREGVSRRI